MTASTSSPRPGTDCRASLPAALGPTQSTTPRVLLDHTRRLAATLEVLRAAAIAAAVHRSRNELAADVWSCSYRSLTGVRAVPGPARRDRPGGHGARADGRRLVDEEPQPGGVTNAGARRHRVHADGDRVASLSDAHREDRARFHGTPTYNVPSFNDPESETAVWRVVHRGVVQRAGRGGRPPVVQSRAMSRTHTLPSRSERVAHQRRAVAGHD